MTSIEVTPCPLATTSRTTEPHILLSEKSSNHLGDDSTANTLDIDFTTELRASFRNAAPRRRRITRDTRKSLFEICEDETAEGTLQAPRRKQLATATTSLKNSAILQRPAHRFKPRVSFAGANSMDARLSKVPEGGRTTMQASLIEAQSPSTKTDARKNKRRTTVYIPPEDTTIPSIHIGVFSPIKSPMVTANSLPARNGVLEVEIAKRQQHKSNVAVPQRAPLQRSSRLHQESTLLLDIAGDDTGKENVPPFVDTASEDKKSSPASTSPRALNDLARNLQLFNLSGSLDATAGEESCSHPEDRQSCKSACNIDGFSQAKPSHGTRTSSCNPKLLPTRPKLQKTVSSPIPTVSQSIKRTVSKGMSSSSTRVPSRLAIPRIDKTSIASQYPVLTEDIGEPSLYEENWLSHQEIAITELLNRFVGSASPQNVPSSPHGIRHDLFIAYQQPESCLLHKRLQASLLYGALSIPKELVERGHRLKNDLGLKRSFIDLWLQNYDPTFLKAAVEVVIGREIPSEPRASPGSSPQIELQTLKKSILRFLETFLLRNEDAKPDRAGTGLRSDRDTGTAAWGYRRTILRSLMIIHLLDGYSSSRSSKRPMRIFRASSKHKSSLALLHQLGSIALPSIGDIGRPLSHLNYHVSYVQYPLQEYVYQIENIAVDLRDGIILTKLVELLLYPGSHMDLARDIYGETTTTITMPSGETLSLIGDEQSWPLSQHLKFPAVSKAAQVYNVQVALSALQEVRGLRHLVQSITADDIVDGHREKTIGLLWGLVGKWGLPGLLDKDDIRREIRRISRKAEDESLQDEESIWKEELAEFEETTKLLRRWADTIARHRNLRADNLTTCFADGKIFEAIVGEYEPYIVGPGHARSDVAAFALHQRLQDLGCSQQFSSLFTAASTTKFFDRDFTIAALAFLCSRLLASTKVARAAISIQRAWRRATTRHNLRECIALIRNGSEDKVKAEVGLTLEKAQVIISRWWRTNLDRRCSTQTCGQDIWLGL